MRVLLIVCAALMLGACVPRPAPAPELPPLTVYGIDLAFPENDLNVTARCIAGKESGGNPLARNGQFRGVFQLGPNYDGTISVTRDGDVWNPVTNSLVARAIFNARGNWSAWSVAGACGVR